ncbi:Mur ligase family protein [Gammaproteobacteria bacterium]|nr:Mur ligase family protein [Gammaproteobacteria bacterium]
MITLLGVGISTQGVAKFETQQGRKFYWLASEEEKSKVSQLYSNAIWVKQIPSDSKAVIISPGIPPFDMRVKHCQIPILTDIDWCYLQGELKDKITLAVTGTNGKSTFVSKLAHVLKQNGLHVSVAGNIGISPFDVSHHDVLIFELSSFQLHYMASASFDCGVIGDIQPDHIDWHGDFAQYQKAKEKLAACSKQLVRGSLNDDMVHHVLAQQFALVGDLADYSPLPFRMQIDHEEGDWLVINDSKATNLDACCFALSHFESTRPLYLICSGVLKERLSERWVSALQQPHVMPIFQGKYAQLMYQAVKKGVIVSDYSQAIYYCQQHQPGVILFSPGGSSFDQFRDYRHRGQVFQQEVFYGFKKSK